MYAVFYYLVRPTNSIINHTTMRNDLLFVENVTA